MYREVGQECKHEEQHRKQSHEKREAQSLGPCGYGAFHQSFDKETKHIKQRYTLKTG